MYPAASVYPDLTLFPAANDGVNWDNPDERLFSSGLDRGVLYFDDLSVAPWNGLIGVDEIGEGSSSVLYRDGNIYYADVDAQDFKAQVRAYFWPDAFGKALGIPQATEGFYVDGQKPRKFDFSYRTLIGSGGRGDRFGHQIHLVYNAKASIGTRQRKTQNNQIQLDEFTFDLVCVPVGLPGFRPSAHYILDTRSMDTSSVAELEHILYVEARMPQPIELYDLLNFGDAITFIDHGDTTWTARGSRENIVDYGNGTWYIKNVNGTDDGGGEFTLQDTP